MSQYENNTHEKQALLKLINIIASSQSKKLWITRVKQEGVYVLYYTIYPHTLLDILAYPYFEPRSKPLYQSSTTEKEYTLKNQLTELYAILSYLKKGVVQ